MSINEATALEITKIMVNNMSKQDIDHMIVKNTIVDVFKGIYDPILYELNQRDEPTEEEKADNQNRLVSDLDSISKLF